MFCCCLALGLNWMLGATWLSSPDMGGDQVVWVAGGRPRAAIVLPEIRKMGLGFRVLGAHGCYSLVMGTSRRTGRTDRTDRTSRTRKNWVLGYEG